MTDTPRPANDTKAVLSDVQLRILAVLTQIMVDPPGRPVGSIIETALEVYREDNHQFVRTPPVHEVTDEQMLMALNYYYGENKHEHHRCQDR